MTSRVIGMERKQIEGKDLREVRDTLRIALRTCEMRGRRLGVDLTIADLTRLGIELLYEGELEILRAQEEKIFFEIRELPS